MQSDNNRSLILVYFKNSQQVGVQTSMYLDEDIVVIKCKMASQMDILDVIQHLGLRQHPRYDIKIEKPLQSQPIITQSKCHGTTA